MSITEFVRFSFSLMIRVRVILSFIAVILQWFMLSLKKSSFSICFRLILAATAGLAHQLTDSLFSVQQLQTGLFTFNLLYLRWLNRLNCSWSYISHMLANIYVVKGKCRCANARCSCFSESERQLHCELMGGSKSFLLDRELINVMTDKCVNETSPFRCC